MRCVFLLAVTAPVFLFTHALAKEDRVELAPSPGVQTVENNCSSCHSLDYILMNGGFLNDEKWNAEVTKMIRVFGAPIEEADAKTITEYLQKNYGNNH